MCWKYVGVKKFIFNDCFFDDDKDLFIVLLYMFIVDMKFVECLFVVFFLVFSVLIILLNM